MLSTTTRGAQETLDLGIRVGLAVPPGVVICVSGSVGVGKTWLAKGIASAFAGIDADRIVSPAFNCIREYHGAGGRRVTHIDFYRLDDLDSAEPGGLFEDYLDYDEALMIVEGGRRLVSSLVDSYLHIEIDSYPDDEDTRIISITPIGNSERLQPLLHHLESAGLKFDKP